MGMSGIEAYGAKQQRQAQGPSVRCWVWGEKRGMRDRQHAAVQAVQAYSETEQLPCRKRDSQQCPSCWCPLGDWP